MTEKQNNNTGLVFIFITVLVDMIGVGIIMPIIPALLEELTSQSLSDAALTGGLLIFAYAVTQFFFAPIMGELSDRYGRKPILLLALFGLGIDYFICAFASTVGILFIGRIMAGVFGASHTVAFAYIADISSKDNKAKNFGIVGAAFGLGFVIGPGLGGVIGANWGVQAPFFVAGVFSLLNFLFGVFFVKESLPKDKRRPIDVKKMIPFVALSQMRKYKSVIGFIIAFTLVHLAGQVMPATWSFFTMERYGWGVSEVGWSLVVVGALVSAVQGFLTGFLVKSFGNRKVIIVGFLCWTLGMFAIAFAETSYLLYAAMVPYVIGGVAGPTVQGLMSNKVSDKEQGNLQGVSTSLVSLMAVIGPLIYTWLFHEYTGDDAPIYFPGAPYVLGAVILVVATVVAMFSLNKLVGKQNNEIIDEKILD